MEEFAALPFDKQLERRIIAERFHFKVRSSGIGKPDPLEEDYYGKIWAFFYYWTEGMEKIERDKYFEEYREFVRANEGKNYWLLKQEMLQELANKQAELRRLKREERKRKKEQQLRGDDNISR
jgi:hypothetical protein